MSQSATEIMRHIVKHELPLMRMLTIMPVEAEKQCSERRQNRKVEREGG
jgi:hypothetical protein